MHTFRSHHYIYLADVGKPEGELQATHQSQTIWIYVVFLSGLNHLEHEEEGFSFRGAVEEERIDSGQGFGFGAVVPVLLEHGLPHHLDIELMFLRRGQPEGFPVYFVYDGIMNRIQQSYSRTK